MNYLINIHLTFTLSHVIVAVCNGVTSLNQLDYCHYDFKKNSILLKIIQYHHEKYVMAHPCADVSNKPRTV